LGLFYDFTFKVFALTALLVNFVAAGIYLIWQFDGNMSEVFSFAKEKMIDFIRLFANKLLSMTGENNGRPSVLFVSSYDRQKNLEEEDRIFNERKSRLDLTKPSTPVTVHKNFCVLGRLFQKENVLFEIDTDSQLSLIAVDYFINHVKPYLKLKNYLDESNPEYGGLGSELKSKYPPLYIDFQIGGAVLSGRFVVSDELKSSPVLIGTDIITIFTRYRYVRMYGNAGLVLKTKFCARCRVECFLKMRLLTNCLVSALTCQVLWMMN
jgi:hypothetical protein